MPNFLLSSCDDTGLHLSTVVHPSRATKLFREEARDLFARRMRRAGQNRSDEKSARDGRLHSVPLSGIKRGFANFLVYISDIFNIAVIGLSV